MRGGTFSVRDLMSTQLVTVPPEATVAEVLAQMEAHGIHEVPVMSGSSLAGWVSYQTLIRRGGVPPKTKTASIMVQPPRLPKDADVIEAADLLIRHNMRALPVVDAKGKVVGVLSRSDVMRACLDVPELAKLPVEAVMNAELETAEEKDPLDRALARLRDLHVNQLLVHDSQGRLAGYVALEDLLNAHAAEHGTDGRGRAATRSGPGRRKSAGVELQSFLRPAPTVARNAALADAVRLMQKTGSNFVAVVEDGYAVGVISRSNVVERIARLRPEPGVLCQIVGLADSVDSSELDRIYSLVERALPKLANELTIQFVTLHFKVYKAKAEGDSKYSLSVHLSTSERFVVQKADAWDPIEATQRALENLEARIHDLKELRLERRKGPSRRRARFYTATRA